MDENVKKDLRAFLEFSRFLRSLNDEELFNFLTTIVEEIRIRQHDKLMKSKLKKG